MTWSEAATGPTLWSSRSTVICRNLIRLPLGVVRALSSPPTAQGLGSYPTTGHSREGKCTECTRSPGKVTGRKLTAQQRGRKQTPQTNLLLVAPLGAGSTETRLEPSPHAPAPHPVLQRFQVQLVPDTRQGVDGLAQHCREESREGVRRAPRAGSRAPQPGRPQLTLYVTTRDQALHAVPSNEPGP